MLSQADDRTAPSKQEHLLMSLNDALFHEHGLCVMPYKVADRAALLPGSGLEAGRVSPLAMALLYRSVLSRCQSNLETEVISEEEGPGNAWLRVSDHDRGEHHLVDLSPARHGTFQRIFPEKPAAERTVQPNHWFAVLRTLSRALGSMCPCCVEKHPTAGWFAELCTDLHADLHNAQPRNPPVVATLKELHTSRLLPSPQQVVDSTHPEARKRVLSAEAG